MNDNVAPSVGCVKKPLLYHNIRNIKLKCDLSAILFSQLVSIASNQPPPKKVLISADLKLLLHGKKKRNTNYECVFVC